MSLSHLITIVRPASELHLTALVVERKPRNVYLARRLEDARRYVEAGPVAPDHHVRRVGPVKSFVRTAMGRRVNKERIYCFSENINGSFGMSPAIYS